MTVTINDNSIDSISSSRSWKRAIGRGLRQRCPNCGRGQMFSAFLKVADQCGHCGEELHHHRADDAPPYFTMFIVGHIVVPLILLVEKLWRPALEVHFILWTVVTLGLTFALMPMVKGAIVALQWALRMHGFDYAARREVE
ncbi:MAG: DUF983 domain-containing protein [Alphaproteobacteria bacterium]|nr:DUF983 domain-containing protein [Alphaproteobacteria bacterium]